jgi:uncharacterized membrane protein
MNDINDQDKLMALLAWLIPIVAIVILVAEDMKKRPFQKYHAVNSLAFSLIVMVIGSIISAVTCGIGAIIFVVWFAAIYWGIKAYQGEWVEVPALTKWLKGQGWC